MFGNKSNVPGQSAPVVMPVNTAGEPDLRGLGRLLWQKKSKILGFTIICTAAAFVVVNAITPRYHSESRVLLEARQNVFLRADADKNTQRATIDPETVASQVQVLLSRDLAREVIKKLNLASKPEFDPAVAGRSPWRTLLSLFGIGRPLNSMTAEERTLEAYYDRLNVQSVAKSRVIVVGFNSGESPACRRRRQYGGFDLSAHAAGRPAVADPRSRQLARRRDHEVAQEGGGVGSQG